uniref:Uncharacterized protein n=1 Tax=Octopus bimaculoides TaxID=37653 RepID=A0A0L8I9G0_OCTBM
MMEALISGAVPAELSSWNDFSWNGITFKTHRFSVCRYKTKHDKIFFVVPQFCIFSSWFRHYYT